MTTTQIRTDAQWGELRLARDDADIECVAMALCWDQRPAYIGNGTEAEQREWWSLQTEITRRRYLRMARVAAETWEARTDAAE